MKRTYEKPVVDVVEVKIEKGFATSDVYGIQQFQYDEYDQYGNPIENSAW